MSNNFRPQSTFFLVQQGYSREEIREIRKREQAEREKLAGQTQNKPEVTEEDSDEHQTSSNDDSDESDSYKQEETDAYTSEETIYGKEREGFIKQDIRSIDTSNVIAPTKELQKLLNN